MSVVAIYFIMKSLDLPQGVDVAVGLILVYSAGSGAGFFVLPAFGIAILHSRNGEIGSSRPWAKWPLYAVHPVMLLTFAAP